MGAAAEAASAALDALCGLQSVPTDDLFPTTALADLVSFYAHFSPLNRAWSFPIRALLPLVRGVRPSEGVQFSSDIASCHHEILLKVVRELHRWLTRQAVFQPLVNYLNNKCMRHYSKGAAWWHLAVERFIMAQCLDGEPGECTSRVEERPRNQEPGSAVCEAIYRQLVSNETFDGRTFTATVRTSPLDAYSRLGKKLSERACVFDLEELKRAVQWEASRVLLIHRDELLGRDSTQLIPPEDRTRPMTMAEAARFMGYTQMKRKQKAGVRALRAAMNSGAVAFERLTRQQYVFSRKAFGEKVWPKITQTGPN
jgi:hypothetical protein